MCNAKWKKLHLKSYILYYIHMTFWNGKNYKDKEHITGDQELGLGAKINCKGEIWGIFCPGEGDVMVLHHECDGGYNTLCISHIYITLHQKEYIYVNLKTSFKGLGIES